jgi:hypothetical protein
MSDISTAKRRPRQGRRIKLGDDEAQPRHEFAEEDLGVSDRTAARMNLPTTYIGGLAYILRGASLKQIAETARRRHEPRPRRARSASVG